MVFAPTGPPPKSSAMTERIRRSSSSRPSSSICIKESAFFAISAVIVPSPFTTAKSRTLRKSRLPIRGVPRLRCAIAAAPSAVMGILRMPALRVMIPTSSAGE